ncbi:efflux RND transporter periplasmic adaptor subunit [Pseudoalteromonas sp. JBTF-M23]|uniref:Efflux RND transporter periplasmic adaptor subunit n=1 Tax=Pseudoalteromonas caenipelagi TaxID=2726988 RepID=A0A849VE77_9GAMM|nr:efflux RND transporter periplasmic adaptor subunit [Pseudoalteromonas caenipelagi]NOU51435.1 efflux RND transporter periplasmic adaptor subunit [Pseudoalteromonas caenipelagi]
MTHSLLNMLIALLLSLLSTLIPTYCHASSEPLVKVKPVQDWSSGLEHRLNCLVSLPYPINISSDVDAKISFVLPSGSFAKQGELIASQDGTYLDFELAQLQKKQQIEKLNMTHAQQEFARLSKLSKQHVSDLELNQLALQRDTAKLNYLNLDSQIQELSKRLSNLAHYAPSDGYVLRTLVSPGMFITNGAAIVEFATQQAKELTCELPHALLEQYTANTQSEFILDSGERLTLERSAANVDKTSQMLNLYFSSQQQSFANLKIAQRLQVTMRTAANNLSIIPSESVILAHGQNYVWQIDKQLKAIKIPIKIIKNLGDAFVVQAALTSASRVVSLGQNGLKEQVSVRILNDQANTHDAGVN